MYIFPGIWIRPAKLVMVQAHHMSVFPMQLGKVMMSVAHPSLDV
jgi:hypothetical protein